MALAAIFDTYKAVSMLEKRGLSKSAAEGITDLLKDVTETNLVTKNDLSQAVQDLKVEFERALHRQMGAHRRDVRASRLHHRHPPIPAVARNGAPAAYSPCSAFVSYAPCKTRALALRNS
jgi:hypothetical protein